MLSRLWRTGPALIALGTLFWSSNFVLGRAIRDDIPPIGLAFWRWTVAFAILLAFAWPHLRVDLPELQRAWKRVVALSFLGVAVFNTLVYIGLHSTTAVNGVLLQSTMPLMIILGSFLLHRERIGWVPLLAVGVSLAGVVVIVARGSLQALLALSINPGDALIFTAVCCYALYSILLRQRPTVHPLSLLAATFAIGIMFLLPVYVAEHVLVGPVRPTPAVVGAIAYVAIFPSILSYLFFNRTVELIGANRTGQYVHLMPVYGSILAAIFLDERLHLYHVAGAALIAAGILVATLSRRAAAPRSDTNPTT